MKEKEDDLLSILEYEQLSFDDLNKNEVQEVQSNINILDDKENAPEGNLKTPSDILNDISNYKKEIDSIDDEIRAIKENNRSVFEAIEALETRKNEKLTLQENLKVDLTSSMENSGLKKIQNNIYIATFVASTVRENFDKDSFKKKYPVLFESFIKKSDVKAYVKLKEV